MQKGENKEQKRVLDIEMRVFVVHKYNFVDSDICSKEQGAGPTGQKASTGSSALAAVDLAWNKQRVQDGHGSGG